MIRRLERTGGDLVARRSQAISHSVSPGTATVAEAGKGTARTLNEGSSAFAEEDVGGAVEYLVVVEKGETSYGAYVPDLPGALPLRGPGAK